MGLAVVAEMRRLFSGFATGGSGVGYAGLTSGFVVPQPDRNVVVTKQAGGAISVTTVPRIG